MQYVYRNSPDSRYLFMKVADILKSIIQRITMRFTRYSQLVCDIRAIKVKYIGVWVSTTGYYPLYERDIKSSNPRDGGF